MDRTENRSLVDWTPEAHWGHRCDGNGRRFGAAVRCRHLCKFSSSRSPEHSAHQRSGSRESHPWWDQGSLVTWFPHSGNHSGNQGLGWCGDCHCDLQLRDLDPDSPLHARDLAAAQGVRIEILTNESPFPNAALLTLRRFWRILSRRARTFPQNLLALAPNLMLKIRHRWHAERPVHRDRAWWLLGHFKQFQQFLILVKLDAPDSPRGSQCKPPPILRAAKPPRPLFLSLLCSARGSTGCTALSPHWLDLSHGVPRADAHSPKHRTRTPDRRGPHTPCSSLHTHP